MVNYIAITELVFTCTSDIFVNSAHGPWYHKYWHPTKFGQHTAIPLATNLWSAITVKYFWEHVPIMHLSFKIPAAAEEKVSVYQRTASKGASDDNKRQRIPMQMMSPSVKSVEVFPRIDAPNIDLHVTSFWMQRKQPTVIAHTSIKLPPRRSTACAPSTFSVSEETWRIPRNVKVIGVPFLHKTERWQWWRRLQVRQRRSAFMPMIEGLRLVWKSIPIRSVVHSSNYTMVPWKNTGLWSKRIHRWRASLLRHSIPVIFPHGPKNQAAVGPLCLPPSKFELHEDTFDQIIICVLGSENSHAGIRKH